MTTLLETPDDGRRIGWPERVALAAILILLLAFAVRQVGSHDLGFHLRAGEQILAGEGWPRHDTFTYTVNDHEYLDTSWGYQVVVAAVHRVSGTRGLVLLHAFLILGVFVAVYLSGRSIGADRTSLLGLLLLSVLISEIRFEVRPEVFSWVFLVLTLHLLHRHASGRQVPLWALPILQLLWVNTHGLFVLGLGAIACFVVGLSIRDRRLDRHLLLASGLAVAVTLINPYGFRGAIFPLTLMTRFQSANVFSSEIGEFFSPLAVRQLVNHPRLAMNLLWLLVALAVLAIPKMLRGRRYPLVALVVVFLPLALVAVRNVPLLAIACVPGIAWALPLGRWVDLLAIPRRRLFHATFWVAVVSISMVASLRVVHDGWYVADRRKSRFGTSWNRIRLPVDAAEYSRTARLRGRVLNNLGFGGYLMWSLPAQVYIDSRLEVMGESFYEEYKASFESNRALQETASQWGVGWIVVPIRAYPFVIQRMARNPDWILAYIDQISVIWVSRQLHPGFVPDASIENLRGIGELPESEMIPGLGTIPRASGLRHWVGGMFSRQAFPTAEYRIGQLHYCRGEPTPAAHHFAAAISESHGAYPEIYNNLGTMFLAREQFEKAVRCYEVVLEDDPGNAFALKKLNEARGQE
jgi:tetratricopeptide (TPR) repeat protein